MQYRNKNPSFSNSLCWNTNTYYTLRAIRFPTIQAENLEAMQYALSLSLKYPHQHIQFFDKQRQLTNILKSKSVRKSINMFTLYTHICISTYKLYESESKKDA